LTLRKNGAQLIELYNAMNNIKIIGVLASSSVIPTQRNNKDLIINKVNEKGFLALHLTTLEGRYRQ
jgi:hypothetical protein